MSELRPKILVTFIQPTITLPLRGIFVETSPRPLMLWSILGESSLRLSIKFNQSHRANDSAQNVTADGFIQVYLSFLSKLRTIYHDQPIFVFTPWGWPNPDGTINYYYPGAYESIVEQEWVILYERWVTKFTIGLQEGKGRWEHIPSEYHCLGDIFRCIPIVSSNEKY